MSTPNAKIGVIHYNWPGLSFDDFLDNASRIGCTHVELMLTDIWPDLQLDASTPDLKQAAQRVRNQVEARGLQVSALGAANDFIQSEGAAMKRQIARMRKVCDLARVLGEETVVRSEGGVAKDALSTQAQWDSMRACFQNCIPFLEEAEVALAVDNHGTVTNEGDALLALLDEINHPSIGSNLDTMNFRWLGHSLEDCDRFYRALAPRVLHAHFKDGFGARENYKGAALGEGEIHLQAALNALRSVGYDGAYTAEYEGYELDGIGYRKCVEWLKKNLG